MILAHLSKPNTARTPPYHALSSPSVYACEFRLAHSNAAWFLRDKPARQNARFYWGNKTRTACNMPGSVRPQQAREVTNPRRPQISNCIIGTSHILLPQQQRRARNVLGHGEAPQRGVCSPCRGAHRRSDQRNDASGGTGTISLVFPRV